MQMTTGKSVVAVCVACGEKIEVGAEPKLGQFVDCPVCDTMLEIVSVSPLKLDWIDEDVDYGDDEWDDDFDDDFEDWDDDDYYDDLDD